MSDDRIGIERNLSENLETRLCAIAWASPLLRTVFDRWPKIALPDCWLSGGAIAQTAWNAAFGLPPDYGLADLDLVYFDPLDLSDETEAERATRVGDMLSDLSIGIDAKNEARVHLWYEKKFGYPTSPYRSVQHAIMSFPTTASAVAIRPIGRELQIFAPYGLNDLLNCTVRANKTQITQATFEEKAKRWRRLWPDLKIIAWSSAD